ncbi:hypothetical protein QQ045_010788 [Rhodiola kirilowii]
MLQFLPLTLGLSSSLYGGISGSGSVNTSQPPVPIHLRIGTESSKRIASATSHEHRRRKRRSKRCERRREWRRSDPPEQEAAGFPPERESQVREARLSLPNQASADSLFDSANGGNYGGSFSNES